VSDQAAALRERAAAGPRRPLGAADAATALADGPAATEAVVIGSGKGGVGKSVLSILAAGALARRGRRTLLVDGSQNQGNLHVLLGVTPGRRLGELLAGEATPRDLLVPLGQDLWLLPADSGAEEMHALGAVDRARLHLRLTSLYGGFDSVIVDSGPGIESVVRVAGIRAARLIVVAVPEPASLSDAYALIKIVHLQVPALRTDVLVNRAESEEEALDTYGRLELAAQRFLRRDLGYAGHVPEHPALRRAPGRPGALLAHAELADALAGRLVADA
jgi:flagellar biosynthesis protein FlhG